MSSSFPFVSWARPREARWTSSGPSARRRARAAANISASGWSPDRPAAPNSWIARSRICCTARGTAILMAWISVMAARLPTVSMSQAVLSTSSRSASIWSRDSATHSRTTPWSASGRPNASGTSARSTTRSIARSAMPERPHAVVDPARAEPRLRDREALALAGEDVRHRHPHVVEHDLRVPAVVAVVVPEHGQRPHDPHARGVPRDQHHALATVPLGRRVGRAHDDQQRAVGVHRAGRPPLAAGDDVLVAVADDAGGDLGGVRRGHVGLGHAERRPDLGVEQRLEPLLLLLRRAELGAAAPCCRCRGRRS